MPTVAVTSTRPRMHVGRRAGQARPYWTVSRHLTRDYGVTRPTLASGTLGRRDLARV